MENSNQHSALRKKLDQHDLGYRPGAWENFEQLMDANPMVEPKNSFWNFRKWFGIGAAALLLSGGALYFSSKTATGQSPNSSNVSPLEQSNGNAVNPTTEINTTDKKAVANKKTETVEKIQSVASPVSTTTTKGIEHLSQHDDNTHPREGDLKLRPVEAYQSVKSGSDDSRVFPTSNKKEQTTIEKKNPESSFHKAPAAHELEVENKSGNKKN